ncbi:alkyl sulfatase dimerization domain-containing protein [Pseudomonadales bacterium]|nr:alkyl sulfatase dimerization domain-containing protein [Pseudomonadales bacterium]MDG1000083.1 alkyl sulfatase dimerization domain-containing protein [Pseudomonadales bacterium]MDG1908954.1 alkyl sulfatase dimerization domain-containing protein [Pseudomonadales bacterium]
MSREFNSTSSTASISAVTPVADVKGQIAHPEHIAHSERLERKLYQVRENVWCMVGNGLSNQSFVEGPEGLICIDTGECVEEMQSALDEVRKFTQAPVVACIYTHFHYVNGTTALFSELPEGLSAESLPIYGHQGIKGNIARYGGEVGPRITRGLVSQFAISMPTEEVDGCVNVGLGKFFRNSDHAPFTPGHVPVTHEFNSELSATIAGLQVEFSHAPSDANDSATIWFPSLGVCINNLVWPALFNVFAIRGEEYRDPRLLLAGLDDMSALSADYLLCAHGPPLSGRDEIAEVIIDYHDSIQLLWDQTVRGVNKGLSLDELTRFVQLPERFNRTYFTRQYYGLVEHHVKQIHAGLFGWFDEDVANLFPLAPKDRASRIVKGFGGPEKVLSMMDSAMNEEDYRWALELGSWLEKSTEDQLYRDALANVVRLVGQRTISANIRNWCLTKALELEGTLNLDRFRQHRFRVGEVLAKPPVTFVKVLRVLLDPEKASDIDMELRLRFDDGTSTGLKIRRGVAIPTDGNAADIEVSVNHEVWANLLGGKSTLATAIADGEFQVNGEQAAVVRFFSAFDHPSFGGE